MQLGRLSFACHNAFRLLRYAVLCSLILSYTSAVPIICAAVPGAV
jgi:hypothetical protein